MKITIGKHPNEDFHVFDDEGNEITDTLSIKSLWLSIDNTTGQTSVQMSCYADAVEILTDIAEVTLIGDER